ncbi:mechanosensitive ion channel protein MscS [Halobacteriales archaeon QS_5_70_15]|nr:MAG: mechanosensitive ion channel protein MscS [Halobacteriales archaeon QS_5_70_15]
MLVPLRSLTGIVRSSLDTFLDSLTAAIPKILAGVVFLVLAYLLIRVIMFLVGGVLEGTFPDQPVYRQFAATIVAVFLWFGVALSFLSIVGLDGIAASLGTATGFLALGVSYALSGMIADAVAGIYLLRDPDFMPGDTIESGGTEGVIKSIELRKTRISVGEDTVVRGNAEMEKKWTKRNDLDDPAEPVGAD